DTHATHLPELYTYTTLFRSHAPGVEAVHGELRPELRRIARHTRTDGGHRKGIQGLLCEVARQDARQLQHGPHRGLVRVRYPGAGALVRELRARGGGFGGRFEGAAGGWVRMKKRPLKAASDHLPLPLGE